MEIIIILDTNFENCLNVKGSALKVFALRLLENEIAGIVTITRNILNNANIFRNFDSFHLFCLLVLMKETPE